MDNTTEIRTVSVAHYFINLLFYEFVEAEFSYLELCKSGKNNKCSITFFTVNFL